MTAFHLRRLTGGDLPFLQAMLREASCWDEDPPHRSVEEVLAEPALGKYVKGWGRPGDAGVVAESDTGERLGAAWYRLFDATDPGFGFVSGGIPELGIATIPSCRGLGVGKALLREVIDLAMSEGHPGLSLSVDGGNARALLLYKNVGFRDVERVGDSWTMLLDTRSPR